jgi:mannitol 2-dehydrogenase
MSCDNLPGNGHVTRDAVAGLAALFDAELADWVQRNVAFPNGMVDRITPATGPRERALAASFGLDDPVPVTCEPFRQWVLEDNFPTGRPALEKVGVTFSPHVHAFETMKIRILNGGHAIIAYPGGLLDIELVHEAMAHPLIAAFLEKVERDEILSIVPPVPGTDLGAYLDLIRNRFANPEIADTVRRLCLDGSNRQPKFIIPSLRDNREAGRLPEGLILASALWCRYCAGKSDSGRDIAPNDPNWERLQPVALAARNDPARWLAMEEIYGQTGRDPAVIEAFGRWLQALWADGTARVLERYLKT